MDILKIHECVKLENERLALQAKLIKEPERGDEGDIKMKIIMLTAKINDQHARLGRGE